MREREWENVLEKKVDEYHRDEKDDSLRVMLIRGTDQKQRGRAYLEISEDEGEFVPRTVQARDRSADGILLHEA